MNNPIRSLVTGLLILLMTAAQAEQDKPGPRTLTRAWQTPGNILDTPESVIYDSKRKVYYVSNINSSATQNPWQDNGGFLSRLDENGKIISVQWVTNLKAPKGLFLQGDYLFVTDLDRIVKIHIDDAVIAETFNAPEGITRLNDPVVDANGVIYVSDYANNVILKVDNGVFSEFYGKPESKAQNGLYLMGEDLIMQGERGFLKSINTRTGTVNVIAQDIDDILIDGIWPDQQGGFYVSDWNGLIYYIDSNGRSTRLLDTRGVYKTADISYVPEKNLVLVPDFKDRIIAFRVN